MNDELLLTIGAMLLLGIFIIASNTLLSNNNKLISRSECYITATSLAQSVIDEAKLKTFDRDTDPNNVNSLTDNLGPEADVLELMPPHTDVFDNVTKRYASYAFSDFDDYNNYRRIVRTPRYDYIVKSVVTYVNSLTPDNAVPSGTKTFCKKITVRAWNSQLMDSTTEAVVMEYAYTLAGAN